jgi:transglutaminase-like putative cysteine protease
LDDNGDGVVLSHKSTMEISSLNSARFTYQKTVLVKNKNGKREGYFYVTENKYCKCKKISGKILDLGGKTLRKLKDEDIEETGLSPGYVLYQDDKHKVVTLDWHSYPYIVEYEYELDLNTLFFWTSSYSWFPQENIPVLESIYELVLKNDIKYYTHLKGIDIIPERQPSSKYSTLTWSLKNIPAMEKEDWMPPEEKIQKALWFTPSEFKLGNFNGSCDSWDSFAKWYIEMAKDQYALDEELSEKIADLTKEIKDPKDKINILYQFLQNNTRYVAIYLGIGGWQPELAKSVYINKYGDCKALSTLMISMLENSDITAYPVLIKTRDQGILMREFPSSQFNHVIVCVPLQKDTLWLECTNDYLAAGELPAEDEGCEVLLVKENSGEIIRTPQSSSRENVSTFNVSGQLTDEGDFVFESSMRIQGNYASSWREILNHQDEKEQKKWLAGKVLGKNAPVVTLEDYTLINVNKKYDQPLLGSAKGVMQKIGVRSAGRIFLNPSLIHQETASDLPSEKERKFPVTYSFPFTRLDSISIKLPDGYVLEGAPKSLEIKTTFGEFKTSYIFKDNNLKFVRYEQIDQKLIKTDIYSEYKSFLDQVVKSDKSKFVFKKI